MTTDLMQMLTCLGVLLLSMFFLWQCNIWVNTEGVRWDTDLTDATDFFIRKNQSHQKNQCPIAPYTFLNLKDSG